MGGPGVLPTASMDVVGRSRELGDLEVVLAATDRLPHEILLTGEAGIGKSTIWRWAVDRARVDGYTILEARPSQSEAGLAFAALGDLLEPAMDRVRGQLPEPQRKALDAALLLDEAMTAPSERILGVSTLSSLRALATSGPVLIAIDDEQWLDAASASVLGFCLRRLRGERVLVLLARRSGTGGARLDTRLPATVLHLAGLSMGALHAVVVERLGTALPRPRLRRLHELSGGNAFVALELVRAASAGRLDLDAEDPAVADVDRLIGARLATLPAATLEALRAAAAIARPSMSVLEAVLGTDVGVDLRPAIDAGIIVVRDGDVHFAHPLLASAAYGSSTSGSRRELHGRLAGIVGDPVERARHVALSTTEPNEGVAAEVELAATSLFRRGAPAAAAGLAQLAVRLTPIDQPHDLRRRGAARAEYLFESGDTAAAADLLESLIADAPPGIERASLLALLARIRHFGNDVAEGVRLHERALQQSGPDDLLTASIHEGLAWGLFLMREDLAGAARHARDAVVAAERAGDDVALAEALAAQALTAQAIGRREDAALDRAMALEPAFEGLRVLRHPSYARGYALACMDRLAEAAAVFQELLARAEEHGDESAAPSILVQLSMVHILAGDWDAAEESARRGDEIAGQDGHHPSQAALRGRLALVAVLRGRLDEGEALARAALSIAGEPADVEVPSAGAFTRGGEMATWALGACHLARGAFRRADAALSPLRDALLGAGLRDPGELRFLPDSVEALVGTGDVGEAGRLVEAMEDMARASDRPTALGLAARCRALVLAQHDDAAAVQHAERAVALLVGGPTPFEAARSELLLGTIQRRRQQKRVAREALTSARSAFERLGARTWVARADAELERIGGRSPSGGVLTATERRVAELVAQGLANKEVAAALGIATKTVELHLSHVYAKLEVGSRTELVRRVAEGNP